MKSQPRLQWMLAAFWLAIILVGCSCSNKLMASQPVFAKPAGPDEQAVQTLSHRFFEAYQQKDISGFLSLWDTASPRYAARAAATYKRFAGEEYAFDSMKASGIMWLPGFTYHGVYYQQQAAVFLDVTLTQRPLPEPSRTDAPLVDHSSVPPEHSSPPKNRNVPNTQQLDRCLLLTDHAGVWRVWNYESTGDFIAGILLQFRPATVRQQTLVSLLPMASKQTGWGLWHVGEEYTGHGDSKLALIYYEAALTAFGKVGDAYGAAVAACRLGEVSLSTKRYSQAQRHFSDAIHYLNSLKTQSPDAGIDASAKPWLEYANDRLGTTLAAEQLPAKALQAYYAAEDGYRQSHNWQALANVEVKISAVYSYDHPLLALPFLQDATHLCDQRGKTVESADAHFRLGECYFALDRYQEAQQAFRSSADQYATLILPGQEADVHSALGRVFLAQGAQHFASDQLHQAKTAYQASLRNPSIAPEEATVLRNGLATVLISLARNHLPNNKLANAQKDVYSALSLYRGTGNRSGAILAWLRAEEIAEALPPLTVVQWALTRGSTSPRLPAEDDNISLLLGVQPGNPLIVHGNLTDMLRFQKQVLALAQGNPQWTAAACLNLATVHMARHADEQALSDARQAFRASVQAGSPEIGWRALATEGRLHARNGYLTPAIADFGKAIHLLEFQRANTISGSEQRLRYLADNSWLYRQMADVLVRRNAAGDAWAALDYSERIKGRLLLDLLLRSRHDPAKKGEELPPHSISLNAPSRMPGAPARPVPGTRHAVSEEMVSHLQKQNEASVPLSPSQIQAMFPDKHSALMEFCFSDTHLIIFVLTPSAHSQDASLHAYAIPRGTIDQLAKTFQGSVSFVPDKGQPDPNYYKPASALYKQLLFPVRASILSWQTLGIVPDGKLWQVPFGALVSGSPQGRPRHLIEDTALFDAYSLKSLWATVQRRDHRTKPALDFVGYGKVVAERIERGTQTGHAGSFHGTLGQGPEDDLHTRPLVEQQLASSLRAYDSDGRVHGETFIREQVTKARYGATAGKARIVQIMSHGIYDSVDPMASYLRFTASPVTGRLSAADLLQTPLHNELMILAACETGHGPTLAGEGLISMAWAAARAGCPATLASQWQIPFDSTALLMRPLHILLASQCQGKGMPLSKAEIVRRSELQVMHYVDGNGQQPYSHPYFWAGFTLIGDGGPLDRQWESHKAIPHISSAARVKVTKDSAQPECEIEVGNGDAYRYANATNVIPGDNVNIKILLRNAGSTTGRQPRIYFPLDHRLKFVPHSAIEFTKQGNANIQLPIPDNYIKFTKNGMFFGFGDMAPRPETALYLTFALLVKNRFPFTKQQMGDLEEALLVSTKCSYLGHASISRPACITVQRFCHPMIQAILRTEARSVSHVTRWYGREHGDEPVLAAPDDLVEFRTAVGNTGTEPISGGHLQVRFPSDIVFAGDVRVYGPATGKTGEAMSSRTLTRDGLSLPSLKPGNSNAITVTFRARVVKTFPSHGTAIWTERIISQFLWKPTELSPKPGTVKSVTGAESATGDEVLASGEASVSICAQPGLNVCIFDQVVDSDPTGLPFAASTSSDIVTDGQKVKYRVRLENNSMKTLRNVIVTIIPPACTSFVPNSLQFDGQSMPELGALNIGGGVQLTDMLPGFCQELTFEVSVNDNLLSSPILRPIVNVKTSTLIPVRFYGQPLELVRR